MEQSKTAQLYLIITIILWSAIPAVSKLILAELDNFQMLCYVVIIGVISLFFMNLFSGKLKLLKSYTRKDYLIMLGMGFLGVFVYHIFLYSSFALAPAGQVNVMNYLWPIFIVMLSIPILHEKFNYKTIIAIVLSFLGAIIALTKGNFTLFSGQYSLGYLLAAVGAFFYGLFCVLGKKVSYDKLSSMLVYFIAAAIFIIPTTAVVSSFVMPKSLTTIISLLALGGLINSLTLVLWFKALKSGHTHKTANLVYIVPFLAMVWTYFLNAEQFSFFSVIGLAFIVTGALIQLKNQT
jgi:drug/metabolite transporter (DMT)-like permease